MASRNKGVELLLAGDAPQGLALLEACLRETPDDFEAQRFRLIALEALGRRRELEAAIIEIRCGTPSASFLISHFAAVLQQQGHSKLAARFYTEAGRLDPGRQDIWIALANYAFDRGDLTEAYGLYQRVLAKNANALEALDNVGKILTLRKEFDRAEAVFADLLERSPDHASALSTLGAVLIAKKDFPRAEAMLTRALKAAHKDETRISIHGNLGILHLRRGERSKAIEAFEHVLELDPSDERSRRALERLGRGAKAR